MALQDLSIDVPLGEVHGLIGPNGAGKTTAINVATGFYVPDSGTVRMFDRDVSKLAPHSRAALGFGRTFQGARLFAGLDVRTNLAIAIEQRRRHDGQAASKAEIRRESDALLNAVGLESHADTDARLLPYGRQKVLEILRALAFASSVLLLDEPAAGLSEDEIDTILKLVMQHRDRLAILIVEHNMDVVMSACDRVTVIDAGRMLSSGTPAQVQADPAVVSAYLGS